jgi:hypothetical protein
MTSDVNSLRDLVHVGEEHKHEMKRGITKKKKRKKSGGGKKTNRRGGCCRRKELSYVHG